MRDSVGTILAALIPALIRTIVRAVGGDEDARKRLADIMPETSRSSLERVIDDAVIAERYGSGR